MNSLECPVIFTFRMLQNMLMGISTIIIDLLQGEAASLTDRYGIAIGLPVATAVLLKKQIQYRYSHGIGKINIFVNGWA